MTSDPAAWLDALAGSHDRLCELVGELGGEGLRRPSYCADWSIAQVLSHLGSGAEIFQGALDAAVAGEPGPSRDDFPPIWDRWNAMTAEEQTESFLATDGRLIESLEELGDRLDELELTVFGGMSLDAVGFLGMRLSEHTLHTWDVAVSLDQRATLDPDAAVLLVDRLPQMAARTGKAEGAGDAGPLAVTVRTVSPSRRFLVETDGQVAMTPLDPQDGAGEDTASDLELAAEALVRLVYGRLDPDHSPDVGSSARTTLAALRSIFPGF